MYYNLKIFYKDIAKEESKKLNRVWVLPMKTWECVLFLMLHRQSGKFEYF